MADDWRARSSRALVVEQLEKARKNSQTQMNKTSVEMEEVIFQRANSNNNKNEYIQLVNKVLNLSAANSDHAKKKAAEMAAAHQQQQQQQQQQPQQVMMGPGGMAQMAQMGMIRQPQAGPVDQDPINALQNLAGQRGGAGMVGRGQPQMGMMAGMPGMVNPQQQHQQQQPQQMEMMRPPHMQPGRAPQQMHAGMHRPPQMQRQDAFMVTTPQAMPGMPGQPLAASSVNMVYQGAGGPIRSMGPMGMSGQYNVMQQGRDPNMVSMPMQGPSQGSPLPMMPSPMGGHQGMMPSPVGGVRQQQMGVPSPNTNLHTPGTAVSEPSPAPPNQSQEELEYVKMLEKLSRYIEPVRKAVQDNEKKTDEESIKNKNKMKGLLGILTDPKNRVKMAVLKKCEQALLKLTAQTTPSADSHMCQSLLDAVACFSTSASLNHSLYRSFGPALEAYTGPAIKAPSPPPSRKRKLEPEAQEELPDLIQGEIARLGRRFVISVDQRFHAGSEAFHLVCRLEELQLPSVPPLLVTLPKTYPRSSPQCDPEACSGYDATEFFRDVASNLKVHLTHMPNRFCLTQLLKSWEMSVRKACDPNSPNICQPNPIFI